MQIRLLLLLIVMLIGSGCEDPENPAFSMFEQLEIHGLNVGSESLRVRETTTIAALIDYSGLEVALVYRWRATGGDISGDGIRVMYQAPEAPGRYTISLKVTDGFITDEDSVTIDVTAH